MSKKVVYLSLGSNLGNRTAYLNQAVEKIAHLPHTQVIVVSSIIETPPWGKTDQPSFLNMAIAIETSLLPDQLLHAVQQIEHELGRVRTTHWGPRTVDIDILLYNDLTIDTPELQIPHPYLTERRFVLQPLAEIAPDLHIKGKTIQEWLSNLATT
ncbi:MAG TPA: 2-amino-4-hydroxy-6-hydroxymethyldihydropteridine diphosphokinase [Armatimonadota bacterium]|nr:2-amino-4-hydroxy-6-hydroxymethyldihydropteridine diphosphokinase [Armatimonadota bacterium]